MTNDSRAVPSRTWAVGSALSAVLGVALFASAQACSAARPEAASDRNSVLLGIVSGPCTEEGATTACHTQTGRNGNIVNCFVGTQTCHDGAWSACGSMGGTNTVVDVSKMPEPETGGGLSPRAVTETAPSKTAGACMANPCNADCMGIDVDAGALQPDGGFMQTEVEGTVIGLSSFPTAKVNALAAPTCSTAAAPASYQVCSYDYCCAGETSTGTCQQWIGTQSSRCTKASGADYTAGIGCQDGSGQVHIPVCNRGTANSPASGKLFLGGYPGNLNPAGNASVCTNPGTSPAEGCVIDLALRPIKAGGCIDVDVARGAAGTALGVRCASAADFGSGNRASMINPSSPTNIPPALLAAYGASTYAQLAEGDKCNNQSFVYTQFGSCATYGVQPPPPAAYTFTYTMACLPGFRAVWNQFGYSTQVPATSEVSFSATTSPALADGGVGTPTAPVTLASVKSSGGTDPAVCIGSSTGCPKNLFTLLGSRAMYNPTITLSVSEIATTALPTVDRWQLSYSCVPSE
jgi:hypothetical protein